ncbi:MAG TPA: HAMP domain-containing sensor histidine kinase [Thermoleophilaceae bacterium]|nr:HAMP domain-containing sensor histidine kinase [Thermoleophilaceae bacterium]
MAIAIGVVGWLLAALLAVAAARLRRRLELVAGAAHELRGPVAAFSYAVAWLRREPGGAARALRFEAELERMRAGLADLDAARRGRRAPARPRAIALERLVNGAANGWRAAVTGGDRGVTVRWDAGRAHVQADGGRLSQALGNLLANAVEHGSGPIEVHAARRGARAVRLEVRDGGPAARPGRHGAGADRGRGLGIAERAIREAGGTLELSSGRRGTVATIELPLADARRSGQRSRRTTIGAAGEVAS